MEIIWDRLVESLKEGKVIPIIGNELQEIKVDNNPTTISKYLAFRLFREYLPSQTLEKMMLPDAIFSLKKSLNIKTGELIKPYEITKSLRSFLREKDFPIPESMLELVKINNLNFFLNTTIDNSLERSIESIRHTNPETINFSLEEGFSDLQNSRIERLTNPVIFNVLGSLLNSTDPAINEEEVLEFTASFYVRMQQRAPNILDSLRNKQLLFIGCSQPEWLVRFFIRVLANDRYIDWEKRDRKDSSIIISSDQLITGDYYNSFLKNYNVQIFEGSTKDFIKTLIEKCAQNSVALKPKKIFLSYSHEDTLAAKNLKDSLETIPGIKCWFDKNELFSGDYFRENIANALKDSDLFIPIISKNSLTNLDKYVRAEWMGAYIVQPFKVGVKQNSQVFSMPIIIDETNPSELNRFYDFPGQSIEFVENGIPNNKFIDRVKNNLQLTNN